MAPPSPTRNETVSEYMWGNVFNGGNGTRQGIQRVQERTVARSELSTEQTELHASASIAVLLLFSGKLLHLIASDTAIHCTDL
jgi:hypothetical protein